MGQTLLININSFFFYYSQPLNYVRSKRLLNFTSALHRDGNANCINIQTNTKGVMVTILIQLSIQKVIPNNL